MDSIVLPSRFWRSALITSLASVLVGSSFSEMTRGDEYSESLRALQAATAGNGTQTELQRAWQVVASGNSSEQLPQILAAMKDVEPLGENWLRAAADTLLERELRRKGSLSADLLEKLVLDVGLEPRARRIAYEWLAKVDADAPNRLLPQMLDDPSLELRYDAVEHLLQTTVLLEDEKTKSGNYRQALRSARNAKQVETSAEGLEALGETVNIAEELGFVTKWKVIGPFDNSGRAGFDKVYPPEQSVELEAAYEGKEGTVRWLDCEAKQEDFETLGNVDLNTALVNEKSVLAYAYATFYAKEAGPAECRYESIEATKLWVNGEEIAVKNVYHSGSGFDQYVVPCQLKKGKNRILIKVCQNEQTEPWTKPWEFRLRVTDSLGGAIETAKEWLR